MEVSGQFHTPDALPPGVRDPDTHWIGIWLGPRAGLDAVAKRKYPIIARAGNRALVVQPVA
jgi:hypothetical protein